jgi:Spy/CpxP family protein refolding chaperone
VEAILTPQQLATLNEINFRRQVVLAVGYPEKQKSIGMTDPQKAEIERIYKETHERLSPVDREMLGKVLEILTPAQREQLGAEIDRRMGG